MLVGRIVVGDRMHIEAFGRLLIDLAQEREPFMMAMPLHALADRLACRPGLSQLSTFTKSPRRPWNTNNCPLNGSCPSCCCARETRPSKPLRLSVMPAASQTRTFGGSAIMSVTPR